VTPQSSQQDALLAKLDEVVMLLALTLKRDRPLTETITELSGAGMGPKRISELVGTTPGYVANVIAKAKTDAKKASPAKKGASGKKARRTTLMEK
jgi:hypothetical protein